MSFFPLPGTSITHALSLSLIASLTYHAQPPQVEVPLALLHAAHVSSSHSIVLCCKGTVAMSTPCAHSHLHPHDAHLAPSFPIETLCIAALTPFLARQKTWSHHRYKTPRLSALSSTSVALCFHSLPHISASPVYNTSSVPAHPYIWLAPHPFIRRSPPLSASNNPIGPPANLTHNLPSLLLALQQQQGPSCVLCHRVHLHQSYEFVYNRSSANINPTRTIKKYYQPWLSLRPL